MRWLLAITLASCTPAAASTPVRVHDGDTFTLDGTRWRLWGVDAPELDQTCDGRPCGVLARGNLASLVQGRTVTCTTVGRSYDRQVGRCFAGNVDLSAAQVSSGWALDYRTYSKGTYAAQEAEARQGRRGIWSGRFLPPWEWRAAQRDQRRTRR